MVRPHVSFAEVKQRISLINDVLPEFGLEFAMKGKSLVGCCPLPQHIHGPAPNQSQFRLDPARNGKPDVWYCFGDCSCGGDVIEFVKRMTQLDDAHVRFWFAERWPDRLNLAKPDGRKGRKVKGKVLEKEACDEGGNRTSQASAELDPGIVPRLPAPLKPLSFSLRLDTDLNYLKQRGVSVETAKRFGLGICRRGIFKGYLVMPVFDHRLESNANPVTYLARWPAEDFEEQGKLRYSIREDFPKSQVLFGLRQALDDPNDAPLVVVEGPFGVFATVQAGHSATAVLGSSLSDDQAALLISLGRRIVLMFDGDAAGINGMRQAAAKLIKHTWCRVVSLPAGSQPDHLTSQQLRALLDLTC